MKVIRDFCVFFLLIQVPRFITWLVMIVNSSVIMKGAQLYQYTRFQPRAWKRENFKNVFFFSNHKEEKRKLKLKPINKKQYNKKQTKQNKQKKKPHTHTSGNTIRRSHICDDHDQSSSCDECFLSSITNAKRSHTRCFAIGLRFQFNLTCKVTSGMVSG